MSSCLVRGVRSIDLVATNLEEASRFYENVWRLEPVEARNDSRYFRGTSRYHHLLGLRYGPQPAVVRIVFDVADRDSVDALHRKISAAGAKPGAPAKLSTPGGGYGSAARIRKGATSLSSATLPTMPARRNPIGRAKSPTSISMSATSMQAWASLPAC